jgi:dTDP-4-dehydrorhamnose 3,5-epimerase
MIVERLPVRGAHRVLMERIEDSRDFLARTPCARGPLALEDSAEVSCPISARCAPEAARGVRRDDPAFGLAWPGELRAISERDRGHAGFSPGEGTGRAR